MIGWLVNGSIRLASLGMTVAVARAAADDPRFDGKGIGPRVVAVGVPTSLLIPGLWLRHRGPYPVWMDNLYLSISALDLAGNVFDLYNRHTNFDLIPHAHGSGSITVLAAWLLRVPTPAAIGLAQVAHVLLEVQEHASDRFLGTHNVRGWWDTAGDLLSGAVGSLAYAAAYDALVRDAGREPPSPLFR